MIKMHNTVFGLFRKQNDKPEPLLVHYLRELNTELILEDRKSIFFRFLKL
jgi:hypothetical protein